MPVWANSRSVFPHCPAATAAIAVPVVHGKKSDRTSIKIVFLKLSPTSAP
ncbi:MAG: hypothetical protein M3O33_10255 [Cyanobacteriota bacterium]|nr:hypothetical protein [Cyanobacteriota bacterium]